MITQKLITDTDCQRFETRVTELTEKGWFIVTDSLIAKVKTGGARVFAVVLYKQ